MNRLENARIGKDLNIVANNTLSRIDQRNLTISEGEELSTDAKVNQLALCNLEEMDLEDHILINEAFTLKDNKYRIAKNSLNVYTNDEYLAMPEEQQEQFIDFSKGCDTKTWEKITTRIANAYVVEKVEQTDDGYEIYPPHEAQQILSQNYRRSVGEFHDIFRNQFSEENVAQAQSSYYEKIRKEFYKSRYTRTYDELITAGLERSQDPYRKVHNKNSLADSAYALHFYANTPLDWSGGSTETDTPIRNGEVMNAEIAQEKLKTENYELSRSSVGSSAD